MLDLPGTTPYFASSGLQTNLTIGVRASTKLDEGQKTLNPVKVFHEMLLASSAETPVAPASRSSNALVKLAVLIGSSPAGRPTVDAQPPIPATSPHSVLTEPRRANPRATQLVRSQPVNGPTVKVDSKDRFVRAATAINTVSADAMVRHDTAALVAGPVDAQTAAPADVLPVAAMSALAAASVPSSQLLTVTKRATKKRSTDEVALASSPTPTIAPHAVVPLITTVAKPSVTFDPTASYAASKSLDPTETLPITASVTSVSMNAGAAHVPLLHPADSDRRVDVQNVALTTTDTAPFPQAIALTANTNAEPLTGKNKVSTTEQTEPKLVSSFVDAAVSTPAPSVRAVAAEVEASRAQSTASPDLPFADASLSDGFNDGSIPSPIQPLAAGASQAERLPGVPIVDALAPLGPAHVHGRTPNPLDIMAQSGADRVAIAVALAEPTKAASPALKNSSSTRNAGESGLLPPSSAQAVPAVNTPTARQERAGVDTSVGVSIPTPSIAVHPATDPSVTSSSVDNSAPAASGTKEYVTTAETYAQPAASNAGLQAVLSADLAVTKVESAPSTVEVSPNTTAVPNLIDALVPTSARVAAKSEGKPRDVATQIGKPLDDVLPAPSPVVVQSFGDAIHGQSSRPVSEPPASGETATMSSGSALIEHMPGAATAGVEPANAHLAVPKSLEIGVAGGTHGWLKVRAEMGSDGQVSASVITQSAISGSTLRAQLPELREFLGVEKVSVGNLAIHVSDPDSRSIHQAKGEPGDLFQLSSSVAAVTSAAMDATGSQHEFDNQRGSSGGVSNLYGGQQSFEDGDGARRNNSDSLSSTIRLPTPDAILPKPQENLLSSMLQHESGSRLSVRV